jgi:hypothetical protein
MRRLVVVRAEADDRFEADSAEKQITRASVVGVKPVLRLWSLAGG